MTTTKKKTVPAFALRYVYKNDFGNLVEVSMAFATRERAEAWAAVHLRSATDVVSARVFAVEVSRAEARKLAS